MKKLLGLTALAAVLVLSACGSDTEETVCTFEAGEFAQSITVQSEDGEIVSAELEMRFDVSDSSDDEIEEFIELINAEEEDVDCDVDNGTLVCTETVDAAGFQREGFSLDLEEFIADKVANGATCN